MAVENGKEAVALNDAGKYFDIILMDMLMPFMNETEATKKLRDMGVNSLIIGTTGSTATGDIENFVKAGLDKFYAKPISTAMYDEMVRPLKKN